MKKIFASFIAVITLLMLFPAVTNAEFISLKGLASDSYITGKIKSDRAGLTGTTIDLEKKLGFSDSAIVPEVEGKLSIWPESRFVFSYIPASYEGKNGVGSGGLDFAGKHFGPSENLKTTMDVGIGSFYYESLFISESMESVMAPAESDYGFLIGVKYVHVDAKLYSTDSKQTAEQTQGIPFPVIGIRLQGMLMEKVQMEMSYCFSSLRANDIRIYWSDFYTELKFHYIPYLPSVPVGLGYKITKSTIDSSKDNAWLSRLGFEGLYLSVSLAF